MAWNCLDNLIYYTTDVYSYQPAYREIFITYFGSNFFTTCICFHPCAVNFICQDSLLLSSFVRNDNLIYYTADVYSYQPAYGDIFITYFGSNSFTTCICFHPCAVIFICQDSLLLSSFVRISSYLWSSWESLWSSVRIFFYSLWK